MGPYKKSQNSEAIEDGWTVTDSDGNIIAHLNTETMADALMSGLDETPDPVKIKLQLALLRISAEHPAWSENPNDILVKIFNRTTDLARLAIGAIGSNEDAKSDWSLKQYNKIAKSMGFKKGHSDRELEEFIRNK